MNSHAEYRRKAEFYLAEVRNELLELDELMQIFVRVKSLILANPKIQRNNGLFYAYQKTHGDSMVVRLRRLVDKSDKSASLYQIAVHIHNCPEAFSREHYEKVFQDPEIEEKPMKYWLDSAVVSGKHLSPTKVMEKADAIKLKAKIVSDWVDQNVAHMDKKRNAPVPRWDDFHAALKEMGHQAFVWVG